MMLRINFLFLVLFTLHKALSVRQCLAPIGQQTFNYLAHRRPYFYDNSVEFKPNYIPEGCSPVRFWYFGRHGSRNPGEGEIDLMHEVLPELHKEILNGIKMGRNQLCRESQLAIEAWIPRTDLNNHTASHLIQLGKNELIEIASRFQKRFPNLFPAKFDNATYLFKHTAYERTYASAKAFAEGIFGPKNNLWMPYANISQPDKIMEFDVGCAKYRQTVSNNPAAVIESKIFMSSAFVNDTIAKISNRLGLERNLNLTEVLTVYRTCAYDTAWKNDEISPWCNLLDIDDFKVLMYAEDLDAYLREGYGHKINYEIACPPIKDLVDYFQDYIDNPTTSNRKFTGYFSHAEVLLKITTRLDIFPTVALKGTNYAELKDTYTWKTSKIQTMASNMAFTLFRCSGVFKIGFYYEELPQPLPACNGQAFCTFEEFRNKLSKIVDKCDLDQICKMNSRNTT